ncbi:MAG TPA: hypothetical protein PLP98_05900 [Plasticicumulans sp.]|nr:hypothetical protein [Plasticicumulans sp.]
MFGTDTSNGNGQYTMSGGSLTTSTLTVGNLGSGSFTQSGGDVSTSQLTLGSAGGTPANSFGQYFLSGSGTLTTTQSTIGDIGRGEFTQSGGTHTVASDLVLGNAPALTGGTPARGGFYTLGGGQLIVAGSTIIGNGNNGFAGEPGGSGSFTQSGGSQFVGGELRVGNTGSDAGGTGSYVLSGTGSLTVAGTLRLGAAGNGFGGTGSFTQTGGSVSASNLSIGESDTTSGGTSSYTLSGGTLAITSNVLVGAGADGTFTQSGGVFTVGNDLSINTGSYALSGGSVGIGTSLHLGSDHAATLLQSGGSLDVGDQAFIGAGAGGNGSYTLSAGTLSADYLDVAIVAGSTGTLTIRGGSATARVNLVIGSDATTTASLVQTGGSVFVQSASFGLYVNGSYRLNDTDGPASLDVTHDAVIGDTLSGSFTQVQGAVTVGHDLILGSGTSAGANGSYAISGGSLDVDGRVIIGQTTGVSGQYTQSGGTVTVGGDFVVANLSGSHGTATLSAGSLSVHGTATDSRIVVGGLGSGSFTLSGGSVTADGLSVGNNAGGSGTFTQTGGSVFVQSASLGLYVNGSYRLNDTDGPASLDVTHDAVIGDTLSGSFTQVQGAVTVGHDLILGSGTSAGANGSYAISGGSLDVDGRVIIGQTTGVSGQYTQSGGTVTVGGDFVVANLSGSHGTATLSAGSLSVHGTATDSRIVVGGLGSGSFTLSGGSVTADGLSVGNNAGGSGTFTQTGGTLTVTSGGGLGRSVIGALGDGTYSQSGGTHVTTDLVLGNNPGGGSGTYALGNAVLSVSGTTWVGAVTTGAFTQTDGSHATNRLRIGSDSGASGRYTLGGGTLSVGTLAVVGDAGTGLLIQTNGTATIGDDLMIGRDGSGVGSVAVSGGTLTVGGDLLIGNFGQGSFSQTSGAVAVAGELLLGGWQDTTALTGSWADGNGVYVLDGGTLDVATDAVVGNRGNGRFEQTGGTFTVANALIIGNRDATHGEYEQSGGTTQVDGELIVGRPVGSTGSYTLSAGRLNVSADAWIGRAGSGTFTQTGGLAIIGGDLLIGAEAGGTGRYRLDSGTLAVGGSIVLGGTTTADGGSGELTLSGSANLYAHGLDLRPGGTLGGLGGGITLGDSEQGNAAAGTIMVNRGGTLAGNGTIAGSITVNDGGTLSPGNSIGTLSVGDVAFASGSTLRIEVDGAGNADLLHSTGNITISGATLRIDSADGTYSADANYTLLTADGRINGTFTNVVTSLPLLAQTATYTGNVVTLVVPTPDENASRSPLDLIGGSPVSLLGRMTLADVEAGFLLDPLVTGIDEGQAGIGARIGRYHADGYRQTYEEMPLRYAWKLDSGLTVLAELPIANISTSGRGVDRRDRSYGFGGGLRVPVAAGWDLKPMFRYGTVVDEDWDHVGSLASASLTSHFRTSFGNGYEFGADNLIGYFQSVGGRVEGLNAGYRLHEVALHNAVRVGGPLEGTFLGSGARWTAWISDTRFLGSELAADNFQRIGIAASTRVRVGERFSENLNLGLHYTQSAGGDHGVELNFGYRF